MQVSQESLPNNTQQIVWSYETALAHQRAIKRAVELCSLEAARGMGGQDIRGREVLEQEAQGYVQLARDLTMALIDLKFNHRTVCITITPESMDIEQT